MFGKLSADYNLSKLFFFKSLSAVLFLEHAKCAGPRRFGVSASPRWRSVRGRLWVKSDILGRGELMAVTYPRWRGLRKCESCPCFLCSQRHFVLLSVITVWQVYTSGPASYRYSSPPSNAIFISLINCALIYYHGNKNRPQMEKYFPTI